MHGNTKNKTMPSYFNSIVPFGSILVFLADKQHDLFGLNQLFDNAHCEVTCLFTALKYVLLLKHYIRRRFTTRVASSLKVACTVDKLPSGVRRNIAYRHLFLRFKELRKSVCRRRKKSAIVFETVKCFVHACLI
jgi:hypothetical protein